MDTSHVPAPRVALSLAEVEALVCTFDWPCATAVCIAWAESEGEWWAESETDDHGLMQLNRPTYERVFGERWAGVYEPARNVELAYEVFERWGRTFGAWTSAGDC